MKHAVTLTIIVLASQVLDSSAYFLAVGHGVEMNPIVAVVGVAPMIVSKMVIGLVGGAIVAVRYPRVAPILALIGCIGCLSELLVVL